MSRTIVAIDGPAGSGKSTVSRLVADKLKIGYVDTGATYRLVALRALTEGVSLDDAPALARLAGETMRACALARGNTLTFNGSAVGAEIRTPEVSEATSIISAHPEVRTVLVGSQRLLVPEEGAVIEGRDIGAVVWPDAQVKVYLDARPDVRAHRRASEQGLASKVGVEVHERDERDATRAVSAMRPAPGAVRLDTSELSAEQVAERVIGLVRGPAGDPVYSAVRGLLAGLLRGIFRLEVHGRERIPDHGGVIIAPNHRSLLDIPVAGAVTRRKVWFMAKEELFGSKFGAGVVTRLGGFPVRRGRPDRSALNRSLALLAAGEIVGIFPEGTRKPDSRFEVLEEGFAYVAIKSAAPIVPVAISGTEAVFPPGRRLPRPAKIRVLIGEPFRLDGPPSGVLPRSAIKKATDVARDRFAAVMNELEPT